MRAVDDLSKLLTKAGLEILKIRKNWPELNMNIKQKEGAWDVVSAADHFVESKTVDFLQQHFPDDGINSEEGTFIDSASGFTWIIDPIDGTTNYLSGMDLFSISLGCVQGDLPVFGIIHYPVLGKTIYAIKSCGAFLNGKSLPQKQINKDLSDCLIVGEIEYKKECIFSRIRPFCRNMLIAGSFTGAALWLVENKIAGLFHTGASRYDIAAASIIAEEAGNVVSGIFEDRLDFSSKHIPIIMACNDNIHQALKGLLKKDESPHSL